MHELNREVKSTKLSILLAFLCFLLIFTVEAFAESKPDSISWPTGFDFSYAIKGEGYSLEEFYQGYLSNIVNSRVEDTYGLALANLQLGLVKKDPFYVVIARALFAANYAISKDKKEKNKILA